MNGCNFLAVTSRPGNETPRRWRGVHKALADPLRVRLLEALWEIPRSARELAECTEMPADRLYYHLGQLEDAGLVAVVDYRRLARGKVERVYAPARVEPPGEDAGPEEMVAFLGAMLDATRADIAAAYQAEAAGRRREVNLSRGSLRLTDQARQELCRYLEELAGRFEEPTTSGEGAWTSVLVALVDLQDRAAPADAVRSKRRRTSS